MHLVWFHYSIHNYTLTKFSFYYTVVRGTRWRVWLRLQTGRSRVRFPIMSLEVFIEIILPATMSPRSISWVVKTVLPPSCADCREIWGRNVNHIKEKERRRLASVQRYKHKQPPTYFSPTSLKTVKMNKFIRKHPSSTFHKIYNTNDIYTHPNYLQNKPINRKNEVSFICNPLITQ
jgi:hypothetical protein